MFLTNDNFIKVSNNLYYVGKCFPVNPYNEPPKKVSIELIKAREFFPELNGFAYPPRGGRHELDSLKFQANRIPNIPPPIDLIRSKKADLRKWWMSAYPLHVVPLFIKERRVPSAKEIMDEFSELNKSSSPGLPMAELRTPLCAATKGSIVEEHHQILVEMVQERFRKLMKVDLKMSNLSEVELVEGFFVDPVRLFIKNEPHPEQKILDKRYRLISSLSIVDEIVHSLVFRSQIDLDILCWKSVPSKTGMGLANKEQEDAIFAYVESWINEARSSDVSGWDWSVLEWLFDLAKEMMIELSDMSCDPFYITLLDNIFYCISRSVFSTSDGAMYITKILGIMLSGMPMTAFLNSRMRCIVAKLAGATKMMSMGDDCVDNAREFDNYKTMGFRITDTFEPDGKSIHFCSHIITKEGSVPETYGKTFTSLMNKSQQSQLYEHLQSFKAEFRNHSLLQSMLDYHKSVFGTLVVE